MRSLMIVEIEKGAQPSLRLTYCFILVEIDAFVLVAAPWAFAEDVVEGAAAPVQTAVNRES